ncbi:HNH endonuclease [Patescibacteria group bacterium]|nr:HNH endonuclease [Patescibacteria group bacterium]MBU2259316.1 HNH endonuclease [Patescibacteria group bacterium]
MPGKHQADQEKIKKILEKRGYRDSRPPPGYDVHHIKPLAEGGKDTSKNIRVIKRRKHQQIHVNRKEQGKI